MGFWMLFVFAWGLGVLLIVLGTFSGAIKALPKSGVWMETVERIFGLLLIGTYFLVGHLMLKGFILPPFSTTTPQQFSVSAQKTGIYNFIQYIIFIMAFTFFIQKVT